MNGPQQKVGANSAIKSQVPMTVTYQRIWNLLSAFDLTSGLRKWWAPLMFSHWLHWWRSYMHKKRHNLRLLWLMYPIYYLLIIDLVSVCINCQNVMFSNSGWSLFHSLACECIWIALASLAMETEYVKGITWNNKTKVCSKYVTKGILRWKEIFWLQLFENVHRYGQASKFSQACIT